MSLRDIQRLVFDKITNKNSSIDLSAVVQSDHLDANTRIAVYQEGYHSRLKESIQEDFVNTIELCDCVTDEFIDEFVMSRNSKSFNMFRYGSNFRDYIFEKFGYSSFAGQLAEFEWRLEESRFLQQGLTGKHFYPTFYINEAKKIRLNDSVYLFQSQYPLSQIVKSNKMINKDEKSHHLIWSIDGQTFFDEINSLEFLFLSCLKTMTTIDEVIEFFYDSNYTDNDLLELFNNQLPTLMQEKIIEVEN